MPYLDYAASAPLRLAARAAWLEAAEAPGNAASAHAYGRQAARRVETARKQVAALVGCKPREVIFTSGGTEADNLALFGLAAQSERRHLIVSAIEHKAVLGPAAALERAGWQVSRIPVDSDGVLDLAALAAALRPETALVSVMAVNNEVGARQPLAEVIRLAHGAGARVHTDAVQAGLVALESLELDLISLSAHKLGGPQGVGALIARVPLAPHSFGGGHERGLRPGTLNVAGIAGFGAAAAETLATREAEAARLAGLRDRLRERILAGVPGARALGRPDALAPHILMLSVPGVDGEALLQQLDLLGLAASSGAACSAFESEPSHVLPELGLSEAEVIGSLRLSLGWATTAAEVDEAARAVVQVAGMLKHMRPLALE